MSLVLKENTFWLIIIHYQPSDDDNAIPYYSDILYSILLLIISIDNERIGDYIVCV